MPDFLPLFENLLQNSTVKVSAAHSEVCAHLQVFRVMVGLGNLEVQNTVPQPPRFEWSPLSLPPGASGRSRAVAGPGLPGCWHIPDPCACWEVHTGRCCAGDHVGGKRVIAVAPRSYVVGCVRTWWYRPWHTVGTRWTSVSLPFLILEAHLLILKRFQTCLDSDL